MVTENNGTDSKRENDAAIGREALPDFMDPETGSSDAGNPNLAEIESILGSRDGSSESVASDLPLLGDEIDDEIGKPKFSRTALVMFVICVGVIVAGVFAIMSNPKWQEDLDCFFSGDIQKCKLHNVEQLRALWRKESSETRPKYGDLVLTYYPQDATVTITQVMREVKRPDIKGDPEDPKSLEALGNWWEADPGAPAEKDIENKSQKLGPNEVVEQLPLMNLPIVERTMTDDKGVTSVRHYEYKVKIERDGYEPREFHFTEDDWQKLGPDVNHSIPWQGCDLVPKPETVKEPFRKAMAEIYCLEKFYAEKGEKAGMTQEEFEGRKKEITVRHGFKTIKDFMDIQRMLTADEEWWKPAWEEILKSECPELGTE